MMRARVRQLGGTLTVESAPGEGTVLSAAVPLSHTGTSSAPAGPPAPAGPVGPVSPVDPGGTRMTPEGPV